MAGKAFGAGVVPGVVGDDDVAQGADGARERDVEGLGHVARAGDVLPGRGVLAEPADDVARDVGGGDELDAHGLGQRADGRGRELVEEARDHPVEAVGDDAVQDADGDVHGHAVGVGPRLELVGQGEREVALGPGLGEEGGVDGLGVGHELFEREGEQVGVAAPGGLPPGVEVARGDDVLGDALVVEREEHVVVDHEAALARARLELLGLLEQAAVLVEELVVGGPLALDQGVADEHLARGLGVDLAVEDGAVGDDGHAVEQDLLLGLRGALLGGPVRLGVGALDEVTGELLGPLGLDLGDVAAPQTAGLDELAGHDPHGRLLGQGRAGEDREACAARAEVLVAGLLLGPLHGELLLLAAQVRDGRGLDLGGLLHADLGEEPGEQCLVDGVVVPGQAVLDGLVGRLGDRGARRRRSPPGGRVAPGAGCVGHVDAERLAHLAQLRDDVLPLAHAQEVDVLGLAQAPERRRRELALLLAHVLPQVEVGEEVGAGVREAGVELVGLGAELGGSFARVLDGHHGRDDRDVARHAAARALPDHAGQARVHGELGEDAADLGEARDGAAGLCVLVGAAATGGLRRGLEGAELGQELHAVADRARVRGLDEREARDVVGRGDDAHRDHLQQDRRERGAQDLRLGELGAGEEVLLGVQADRDAVRDTARAPRALVGAGLRDGLDRQALHLGRLGVARDAGRAGVDDVVDAGDRQRRLGDVGREHDAARGVRLEHAVLLGRGQARVERQDLDEVGALGVPRALAQAGLEGVGRVVDLALARQEDQDVAWSLGHELLDRVDDARDEVLLLAGGPLGGAPLGLARLGVDVGAQRPVPDLDGVGTTRDLDDGSRGGMVSGAVGPVDCHGPVVRGAQVPRPVCL
ncbi:hypothetical protein OERS_28740 [Oerskovia enterophila]|uniref:NAD-specific glutamate dehydrogenase n=1 Tax=Oerskovia enterophila TaxID=43678 RepID=A0ABX2Y2D7_9CELL|nr:hypothetical protein OERS_28740 [Oerskovia enterophila]